jgi:hypothetical protein
VKFFTLLLSFSLSFSVFANTTIFDADEGRHFIELSEQEGTWVVEDYLVRPGQLQEQVLRRSFPLKTHARLFIENLQQGRTQLDKPFSITTRETGAVALWNVTQAWDLQWEEKYSQWVEQNLDKDFFVRNKLATDCADVAYALRWIFARNNGLPMGATLAGTQVVFTHESGKAEWAQLPTHADWTKDQRFLRALNWLLNTVYTRTLWIDGYPLEISSKSIRPGVINLLGGHTELIARLINDGKTIPIQLLSSTVPRQVRELYGRAMTDGTAVTEDAGGLIQFRWLEKIQGAWVLRAKSAMPLYSREQYQEKLCEGTENFSMCIYQRLGMTFNPRAAVLSMIDSLAELARARITVVREGLSFCAQNNCEPGTQGWEDHSTPTRDARLRAAYVSGEQVVGELSILDSTLYSYWYSGLTQRLLSEARADLTLATFLARLNAYLVSSDPRDPLDSRWASTSFGIATSVKNVFERQSSLREKLLTEAAPCRQDRALCSVETELFTKTNTLELDFNARSWLARYAHFCVVNACPATLLPVVWESTWFQSSLPWDSLDVRRGTNQGLRKSRIFYGAKNLEEIGDVLLLDQHYLVHRLTGAAISLPTNARLAYHAKQKHLLAIHPDALYLWNGAKFVLVPIEGIAELGGAYDTQALGEHHLIIFPRMENPDITIVDLRDGEIRLATKYIDLQTLTTGTYASIITFDNVVGGKIVYEEQGQYREIDVEANLIPHRLWGQQNGRWIGSRTSHETSLTTVYGYTPARIEKLVELPIIYNSYLLNNVWLAQTENAGWILNRNSWLIEQRYPGVWVNQIKVYDFEIFQFAPVDSSVMKNMLIHKNNQTTAFVIPSGQSLTASHPDWLTLNHDTDHYSVVSHAGRALLPAMEKQSPRSCTNGINNSLDCASTNLLHAGWNYQHVDGDRSWVVTNFGSYGKLNPTLAPWAQGLWSSNELAVANKLSTGFYGNLEGGSIFSPFTGVLIYFPKN